MRRALFILFSGLLLFACVPQVPVIIRVTPTQDPNAQPAPSATQRPTQVAVVQATDTVMRATDTIAPPTATGTATRSGDGRFLGPVVGPDRTAEPTDTLPPPPSPTVAPTATPFVYPETPVATDLAVLPQLDPNRMGIQLDYNIEIDLWWQMVQRTKPLGVQWVKVQADWGFLQPDSPQQFDSQAFSLFEANVQRVFNEGFNVLVSVAKAPLWARGTNEEAGPPNNPQDLANFLNFMLGRVGGQITAVEIWNEPNLRREWNGNLEFSGRGYMQLFDAAYQAIRDFDPDMPVVTAGLAPTGTNGNLGSVDDRVFLQQMYDAGLASGRYTNVAIGFHPYGWGNPPDTRCCNPIPNRAWDDDPHFFFLDNIDAYRAITVRNGHEDVQLWATEFGWPSWAGIPVSAPEAWMTYTSPNQQADYTLRAFEIGQALDFMGPMFLWNLNFANQTLIERQDEKIGYSLLIPGLPIRPIYDALVQRPRPPQ